MDTLGTTGWIIGTINTLLDSIFLGGGLIVIWGYPLYYFYRKFKKQINEGKINFEVFPQTLLLLGLATGVCIVWISPELIIIPNLPKAIQLWEPTTIIFPTLLRLVELSLMLIAIAYLFGHEYGDGRWLRSSLGHIVVIFLGFAFNRWGGILFITLPTLLAYYYVLYRVAIITLPASNPENIPEKWKRFGVLVSYAWGMQYPLMVVGKHAWDKIETRIPGDFARDILPAPGFIWTRSHQIVSITGGMQFKRVNGPGVVFTSYLERPEQVFDLRLQLRTNEIEVVSKDGISFVVRVFTGFRMDPTYWDKDTYERLRKKNTILRGADKPSHTRGSFPYSSLRVQAALGVTSTKVGTGNPPIYWDQWAINVVEDQARKVISQKKLDELWRPAEDGKFANAMDSIADEIKEGAEFTLHAAGILLVMARVVNFRFPENGKHTDEESDEKNKTNEKGEPDEILQQQIATWAAEWDKKRDAILAEADAESEQAQQSARTYAEELKLNSIIESLKKTKEMDPRLPQYVIAMRFLSALQDRISKQPPEAEEGTQQEKKTTESNSHLKEQQNQIHPRPGKER